MIVQVVIVLFSVIVLVSMGGEVQLKPFYFNVGAVLYFVILMALVVGVEGFFFTYLEQWYTKSFSARSYMLKRSIRRSMIVIAVAAVAVFLVLTPFVADAIANATSESGETSTTAVFRNRDALGLTTVERLRVESARQRSSSSPRSISAVRRKRQRPEAAPVGQRCIRRLDLAFPTPCSASIT